MPEKRQPFTLEVAQRVDALNNMAALVETDLRALFSYYGEDLDSPEGPKPDDFFGMICSFSSSLQVRVVYSSRGVMIQFTGQKAALEIHDRQKKVPALAQGKMSSLTQSSSEEVRGPTMLYSFAFPRIIDTQIVKAPHDSSHDLAIPSTEHSASIGRGNLEEAMRSLREGRKRCRPPRSITGANKIFLDGRPELS